MKKLENIILIAAGIFFIFFIFQVLAQTGISWIIDFKIASDWASSISGVLAFFSFVLIYFSFKYQQKSFNKGIIESKFFEKVKIHRENVQTMEHEDPQSLNKDNIQVLKGVRVFMTLLNEFNQAFFYLDSRFGSWKTEDIYRNKEDYLKDKIKIENGGINIDVRLLNKINISYLILYYGVTSQGKEMLRSFLKKKYQDELVDSIVDYYESMPVYYSEHRQEFNLMNYVTKGKTFNKFFCGHQNRLGHYFRHMFQTVNYINARKDLEYKEKYEYIKTYRAQFSTYEQAIIFLNSLSQLGETWELNQTDINTRLITKYNLIKNLSTDFVSKISVKDFYPYIAYEVEMFDLNKRNELEKKYK
ncbi:putative phage abortive infection protein [Saccharicrinis sp. FJH2]|uniref:putative phage abortive infection protein n=1 Tax=Saccharicrinis sp. FJH65 TaxID=3344659 RepID=UPI0035F26C89